MPYHHPLQSVLVLLRLFQTSSWLCHWCPCETAAVGSSGLCEAWESLVDIPAMSPLEAAQLSGACQRQTSVPVSGVSLLLSPSRSCGGIGCYRADGAAWLSSSTSSDGIGLFSPQSRVEGLQGHARLQWKFLSPVDSCSCKLPFCVLPLSVLCVQVELLDAGCGLWAHCRLSLEPVSQLSPPRAAHTSHSLLQLRVVKEVLCYCG